MLADENPYAPPKTSGRALGINSGRPEDLKIVAVAQKSIIICILIYFCLIVATFFVPPQYNFYLLICVLLLGLVSTVSVFLLAMKVYGPIQGVLVGILTMVPCLGLLMLLLVNQRATKILKDNGHPVGLLGADLSRF
jgi:uncharacterized membrane-anchored protein